MKKSFRFTSPDSENTMGRRFGCWFVPIKVILKFGALFFFPGNHLGFDYSLCLKQIPHSLPGALIIIHPLSEDIPCARYWIYNAGDSLLLLFGLDKKPMGFRKRIGCSIRLILEKKIGQRLQTLFPGDCGPGAFFWTERKVDIFQHRHRFCRSQLFSEFLGQKVTFPQALYDRFPSLIEFFELLQTIANRSNLNFVKRTGGLFSVASNERHRGTIREERANRTNLVRLQLDLSSNFATRHWSVALAKEGKHKPP